MSNAMSYKHKITTLILVFLVMAGFISSGSWFFHKHIKDKTGSKDNPNPLSQNNGTKLKVPKLDNFSQGKNVPNGVLKYGGSTSWAEPSKKANPPIQAALPKPASHSVQRIGEPPSSGAGIKTHFPHPQLSHYGFLGNTERRTLNRKTHSRTSSLKTEILHHCQQDQKNRVSQPKIKGMTISHSQ